MLLQNGPFEVKVKNAFFSGPAFNFHDARITAQARWHRKRRGFLCEAAAGGKKKDQKKNFSCSRGHLLRLAVAGRARPEGRRMTCGASPAGLTDAACLESGGK